MPFFPNTITSGSRKINSLIFCDESCLSCTQDKYLFRIKSQVVYLKCAFTSLSNSKFRPI
uniref:Uncharacterized protein n=1 Tax=Anguilla anguilla TaxID=7936 RepID=A0A0E9XXM0_ANGAN